MHRQFSSSMIRGRTLTAIAGLALLLATLPACGGAEGDGEAFPDGSDPNVELSSDRGGSKPDAPETNTDPVENVEEDNHDSVAVPDPVCEPGERRCSTDQPFRCGSDGHWVPEDTCENGCSDGFCLDAPSTCEEGETRCAEDATLELCEWGEWSTATYCRFDCIDDPEPRCVHCDPDASTYCDGDVLRRCDPASGLTASTSCQFGCSAGACNPRPDTVLRVENATNYDMISIRLDGAEQFTPGHGIFTGQYIDFTFDRAGTVDYELEVGFYNDDATATVYFWSRGSTTLREGETTVVRFDNPTIGELLSSFGRKEYVGYQYSPLAIHRYVFFDDGRWDYYRDGLKLKSGRVQLVSWDLYASVVQFKLCATCETTQFLYPWGSFFQRDGSGIWKIVEYFSD